MKQLYREFKPNNIKHAKNMIGDTTANFVVTTAMVQRDKIIEKYPNENLINYNFVAQ